MSRPKDNKKHELSIQRAVRRVLILTAAYLLEEDGWDVDRLGKFYEDIVRWINALSDHMISINKVIEILNEKTEPGQEIKW